MTTRSSGSASGPCLVGCLFASLTLLGCSSVLQGAPGTSGGGTGGGGGGAVLYEHATGSEDVLVSVDLAGWYGPLEYALRNTASFLLLGDGTAIVPAAIDLSYPGPAINPLQSSTLTEQQIQELFAAAEAAGLLGAEIDFGEPGITDQATTYLDITVDGTTFSQAAYALDYIDDDPNLSEASRAARAAARDFVTLAQAMVGGDSEQYVPTAVLAHRVSSSAETSVVPELEQEARVWPIGTAPPPIAPTYPSSCVAIAGAEAAQLVAALVAANELTPWLIGAEPPTRMAFRPLLPGDPGCQE